MYTIQNFFKDMKSEVKSHVCVYISYLLCIKDYKDQEYCNKELHSLKMELK